MKIFWIGLCFILVCACSLTARADDELWTALKKRPDVTIETQGGTRIANFKSGVVMQEIKGGKTVGMDNSGHGAVLCAWRVYAEVEDWLDVCSPEKNAELKKTVGGAMERINKFILENSLTPGLRTETEKQLAEKAGVLKDKIAALTPEEKTQHCTKGNVSKILKELRSTPPAEFEKGIDRLLAVPRPAVLNPCL